MELDELKPAWSRLEERLAAQNTQLTALLQDNCRDSLRLTLRPLLVGQIVQLLVGVLVAGLGAQFWIPRTENVWLLGSGLITHAYGVAMIINAIRILVRIRRIDYSLPVAELQRRVVLLEKSYLLSGWILGLPWWLLWIPVSIVFVTLGGFDVTGPGHRAWIVPSVVFGMAGIAITVVGYHSVRRHAGRRINSRLDRLVAGVSLHNAKMQLREIEEFVDSSNRS